MAAGNDYDVVVIGAGAGGLAAATFAALEGARVLLVERTGFVGGTTAYSAGTAWVPNTRLAATVGAEDSPERALAYLDSAVGNRAPRAMREAFLAAGPKAIHRLMDATVVQFRARPFHPDYLHELEGSTDRGRALEPEPFRAAALGRDLNLIRPAIPEFTILGGLQVDRTDIGHLLSMGKSLKSLTYSVGLVGAYLVDRLRFGRSARLVMGNALVGRLLFAAKNAGVELRVSTQVTALAPEAGGMRVSFAGGETALARGGVILATGGFSLHPARRAEMLPRPLAEHSPGAPGHTGELHDIALGLGARYGEGAASHVFWAPVSKRQRADGSWAVFPHFVFDRSKPGIIAVGADGRRFTNEARSYHEFALAQYATGNIPAFLVTDAEGLRKYGLGMVRPGGHGAKALAADGYLVQAPTLAGLAGKLGVDAGNLTETVEEMNGFAETGVDARFHRGETVYERANGDASHGPNPTLGRIGTGPFCAVRLWPGDIGAATGLATDEHARVLDGEGKPIPGLFACGNDMQSIMGGVYPGPGITIGPAITFGYIAALDAVGRTGASG
jgi:glycine/D-amino acid oxidase-like deaminating enzyme